MQTKSEEPSFFQIGNEWLGHKSFTNSCNNFFGRVTNDINFEESCFEIQHVPKLFEVSLGIKSNSICHSLRPGKQ